ncbi:MAG TPA: response regulator [Gemmatimonadales bacterium]|nr:response regulator [Gemmatimonadales bacterium]
MANKPKILIVDDDEQFALLVAGYLRGVGYPSLTAVDAMQGFMFAQREQPGLILLDINMPAGGGLTLLERLVKSPKTQMIPIVVLTARSEPEVETQARGKGAADFLRKPIERNAFLAIVARLTAPI